MPATLLMLAMTWEAEMNQLSRFQHLAKMMKLIATHVGLGQDSDPFVQMLTMVSDPDWSPEDDQDHDDIAGDASDPHHLRNKRKLMIPYALRMTTMLPREMVYFSVLWTLSQAHSMLMILL